MVKHGRAVLTPQSNETILKVAKISPTPSKKQLMRTKTLFENIVNKKIEKEKSVDFQASEHDIDLSNAPLFQMLCEISHTI